MKYRELPGTSVSRSAEQPAGAGFRSGDRRVLHDQKHADDFFERLFGPGENELLQFAHRSDRPSSFNSRSASSLILSAGGQPDFDLARLGEHGRFRIFVLRVNRRDSRVE